MTQDDVVAIHTSYLDRYVELALVEIANAGSDAELNVIKAKYTGKNSPLSAEMRALFAVSA